MACACVMQTKIGRVRSGSVATYCKCSYGIIPSYYAGTKKANSERVFVQKIIACLMLALSVGVCKV